MLRSLTVLAHKIVGLLLLLDFLLHHLENIHRCRSLVFLFTEHLSKVLSLVVRVGRLSRLLANVLLVLFPDSFLVNLLFEVYLLGPSLVKSGLWDLFSQAILDLQGNLLGHSVLLFELSPGR